MAMENISRETLTDGFVGLIIILATIWAEWMIVHIV